MKDKTSELMRDAEVKDKTSELMRKESRIIIPERISELMRKAEEIQLYEAKEAGALGFMNQSMVLATLPHRNPGDITEWVRRNGDFHFICTAGKVMEKGKGGKQKMVSAGIPYGSKPRLLTYWISTEATITKSRELELGDSLSAFMRAIGLEKMTGGKYGSITALKDQMRRTLTATFQGIYGGDDNRDVGGGYRIAKSYDLWWTPQSPEQAGLWKSTLTLSEDFFSEILRSPVPIDLRAIKVLRASPMALDIYTWLTHRNSYLQKETRIPWQLLMEQFGSGCVEVWHFRPHFEQNLRKVLSVYPQARVRVEKESLILQPSPTHVRKLK